MKADVEEGKSTPPPPPPSTDSSKYMHKNEEDFLLSRFK
jgi:hypothetical protein